MRKAGGKSMIVAKIERAEAIAALEEILDASDAIMVARGDLAVEVGDAVVPALQKRMIRMAREKNKAVITATQMMESMITNPIPTRAEVSDVANAVLDGTDAVMLSAETAAGLYPVETIAAMARVCVEAEKEDTLGSERRRAAPPADVEEAIARATMFSTNSLNIKAVAAMTQSGKTALLMSRVALDGADLCAELGGRDAAAGDAVPRRVSGQIQGCAQSGKSAEHGRGRTAEARRRCRTATTSCLPSASLSARPAAPIP